MFLQEQAVFTSGLKAHDRNTLLEAGFRKKHLCGFAIGTRCCCTVFFRPTKGASVMTTRVSLTPWDTFISVFQSMLAYGSSSGDWSPFVFILNSSALIVSFTCNTCNESLMNLRVCKQSQEIEQVLNEANDRLVTRYVL